MPLRRIVLLTVLAGCGGVTATLPEGAEGDALNRVVDSAFCETGLEGAEDAIGAECGSSCNCLLANPDHDWCPGQTTGVCTLGQCYKKDAKSADCSSSYSGTYCGCFLDDGTTSYVAAEILVSEAQCQSAGTWTATKLKRFKQGDTWGAGYDDAYCDWAP